MNFGGGEVLKQIRWKFSTYKSYQNSNFYRLTPGFIFSEIVSKSAREMHYEEYSQYLADKKLSELTEEEHNDLREAGNFARNLPFGVPDLNRFNLMDLAVSCSEVRGPLAEFGVFKGESINHIAALTTETVHGFDSFKGLPEDWNRYLKKGHFSLDRKKLPRVRENVKLHVGLFSETLPEFREEIGYKQMAFLHVDCDLYSSTKEIFTQLEDNILPGTVILFDEFYNYPGWRDHEFRAFNEFLSSSGIGYRYIGFNSNAEQVAVIME